jgi:hypothetical protein
LFLFFFAALAFELALRLAFFPAEPVIEAGKFSRAFSFNASKEYGDCGAEMIVSQITASDCRTAVLLGLSEEE